MELIFLFILGLVVGSFLNVLIDRYPTKESLLGRSHCDFCHKKLRAKDLVPVLSFIFLKGRCRYCHKKLSYYYPVVELLTGIMFVLVGFWTSQNDVLTKIAYLGLFSVLIAIFFEDLKYQIIPDELQIAFFVFAFFIVIAKGTTFQLFAQHLFSGAVVMAPMHLLHVVTKGKGMGFADVKLSFTIGFLLGILNGFLALYFGFVLGALVGVALLVSGKKKWKSKIAFGPFLVLGLVTVLIFQAQLNSLIRNLFGI